MFIRCENFWTLTPKFRMMDPKAEHSTPMSFPLIVTCVCIVALVEGVLLPSLAHCFFFRLYCVARLFFLDRKAQVV